MQGRSNQAYTEIQEKVKCPVCRRFFGYIRDDGTGPLFDGCPDPDVARIAHPRVQALVAQRKYVEAERVAESLGLTAGKCPMSEKLAPFQPKPKPVRARRRKAK